MSCIDLGEMQQDMKELSLAIWAQGDAVRHLHGADPTLAEGLCHTLQRLTNELECILPHDADSITTLSAEAHTRLMNVSAMLLAAVEDSEVEVETARSAATAIREVLGAMS